MQQYDQKIQQQKISHLPSYSHTNTHTHASHHQPAQPQWRISSSSINTALLEVNVQTSLGIRILTVYEHDDPLTVCQEFCYNIERPDKVNGLYEWLKNILQEQKQQQKP